MQVTIDNFDEVAEQVAKGDIPDGNYLVFVESAEWKVGATKTGNPFPSLGVNWRLAVCLDDDYEEGWPSGAVPRTVFAYTWLGYKSPDGVVYHQNGPGAECVQLLRALAYDGSDPDGLTKLTGRLAVVTFRAEQDGNDPDQWWTRVVNARPFFLDGVKAPNVGIEQFETGEVEF